MRHQEHLLVMPYNTTVHRINVSGFLTMGAGGPDVSHGVRQL
jgi:hypothetical protein